tara:strand:- start:1600 stop:3201 length:1602 start_codon:yes stop_codon:yes gene_type:complete
MDLVLFKNNLKFIKNLFLIIIIGGQYSNVFAGNHREIDNKPRIDPKVLIKQTTVLIENDASDPGSGVIVKKEGDLYTVLTAAHVVCNRTNQTVDTEEFNLRTADGFWHSNLDGSDLQVICPPVLMKTQRKSLYCTPEMSSSYPWPIDLAILKFRSEKKYMVAQKQSSIRRLGKDVYVAGYPFSENGKFFIRESEGTLDIPPSSITETCKGYGLRYIAPTEIGMSGGGVWSKKGKLVGIHGYREVSRKDNIVIGSRGSYSAGIHLPYWKQMVDPFNPSKGFPENLEKTSDKDNVAALISKARSFINIARISSRNNNPNLVLEESSLVLESLKKAQSLDSKQPVIPALIAQVYIRKFEDGSRKEEYLIEALTNINKAIRLYNPLFLEKTRNYDGSFEKIRAYIHFKYGEFINNNKSILSYRDAIEDIDVRLSAKPDDVASWKDKAKYHFYANELSFAYQSLIKASILAPKDPSILIDMGIVLYNNKDIKNACERFNRANNLIDEGLAKQGNQGAFAKDYEQQKLRIKPYKDYLGC